LDRRLFEEE
jgi:hypothetical protein